MALPDKGDPTRPLHLAARSSRLLGMLMVLLGTLVLAVALFTRSGSRGTALNQMSLMLFIGAAIYLLPGIALMVIVRPLRNGKMWAIVTGMGLAGILLLFATLSLGGTVLQLIYGRGSLVALAVSAFAVLAFGQMLMHVIQGYRNRRNAPDAQRGFEPLMVQPIPPSEDMRHRGTEAQS